MFNATARIVLALAVAAAALATLGAASPIASDRASYIVLLTSSVANPAALAQEPAPRFVGKELRGFHFSLLHAAKLREAGGENTLRP